MSSFTKAAAQELVSRNLPLDTRQVGTLHALCYRQLGSRKVLTGGLLKDWNDEHPTKAFAGYASDLDDPYAESTGQGEGDRLLQELGRRRGLEEDPESWPITVQAFAQDWQDFKDQTGTIDFTDMIELCLKERVPIPNQAAAFFLDEVQDFSPLELRLARQWGEECEVLYLVGDEDQSLYHFKGCKPDAFMNPPLPPEQIRVLGQSHRVPRAVHAAALDWIEQVTVRMPKDYKPRDADGTVESLFVNYKYPESLLPYLDEWLAQGKTIGILGSCSFIVDPTKHLLKARGIPFHNPYRTKRGDWNPLGKRVGTVSAGERLMAFMQHQAHGQWWTYEQFWRWAAIIEADQIFARGAKTAIRHKAERQETANVAVATEDLDTWLPNEVVIEPILQGSLTWLRQHLLSTHEKPMEYACRVYENHGEQSLSKKPQIILGTIHSVKGGEMDVCVVFPDLSQSGYKEWITYGEAQDSVRRMFYVAMTRAKESLYWAQPVGLSITGYL